MRAACLQTISRWITEMAGSRAANGLTQGDKTGFCSGTADRGLAWFRRRMPGLPCEWLHKLATRGVVGTMRLLYR